MARAKLDRFEYTGLFNRSLMRRRRASGKVSILSAGRDRILFMPDDCGRPFDQATRDYHHALRRIQYRRARSVANRLMIPWRLITAVVILVVSCLW